MGADYVDRGAPHPNIVARSHWTGLPPDARRFAAVLLITIVVIDGIIQYVTLRQRGWPALAGGENLLGFWDLAKALTVGIALIFLLLVMICEKAASLSSLPVSRCFLSDVICSCLYLP